MQSVATSFDRLAPFYNLLSRMVFGKTIRRAERHFLHTLQPTDQVLILGGGSGHLLKALLNKHPKLTVDYIDISPKMIDLAQRKTSNPANVNFIIGTAQSIPDKRYSIIITNFYLDLFSTETLHRILPGIKAHLNSGGHWLATDFICHKFWHTIMLWIMYRFFRITTGIEAKALPDWENQLSEIGLKEVSLRSFYSGFIKSSRFISVT